MSKKASPTAIGSFVLGAILLVIVGLAYLGTVKWSDQSREFVLFFDESVNGLDIGSRVKYRGVPVGQVKEILISLPNQLPEYSHIPVIVEVEPKTLKNLGGLTNEDDLDSEERHKENISEGMRGQLQVESMITGLYYIEIDIKKNAPPPVWIQDPDNILYKEVPTVPSPFAALGQSAAQIIARVGSVNWEKLVNDVIQLAGSLRGYTEEFDLKGLTDNMNATLTAVNNRLSDQKIDDLMINLNETTVAFKNLIDDPRIDESFDKLTQLLDSSKHFVSSTNSQVDPLMKELRIAVSDLQKTLGTARTAFNEIENAGKSAQALLTSESSLRFRIETALTEFAAVAKSIERLADQLERNPKSILTGKAK